MPVWIRGGKKRWRLGLHPRSPHPRQTPTLSNANSRAVAESSTSWSNDLHPLFGRLRVEHYNNAEKQGAAAARSMLGSNADYVYVHSLWSDQYEHKLEYVGHTRHWDHFDPSVAPRHQMLSVSIGDEIQSWISMARWRRACLPGDGVRGA